MGLHSSAYRVRKFLLIVIAVVMCLVLALPGAGVDKKKKQAKPGRPTQNILNGIDLSKIFWPAPPNITRVKYTTFWVGEKFVPPQDGGKKKKKQGWMERLAGAQTDAEQQETNPRFVLVAPYGMAVDSKDHLYVADTKVGAIFIFNTETKDVELIKNGTHAKFGRIVGLAIDDADKLFVSDNEMKRVVVFNPNHEVIGVVEGLSNPAGLAIDDENRLLYIADIERDQVLVYDADTLKPLRKIGTTGKNHELTTPGDFSKPTGVAVDNDGNLYVTDMMNNRVEMFDANGKFIGEFGKAGDGPGTFARPKGIAIDSDNHIWVADSVQDRLQVFNKKGQLLTYLGGHGHLPGQFAALCGVFVDRHNRVFTSEQYPGRVQQLLYITDAQAAEEKARRDAELTKKSSRAEKQSSDSLVREVKSTSTSH